MTEPRVPARVDRATALTIAARIHTGRGTSPYRLMQDAEVIADYLRTGEVPEPSGIVEVPWRMSDADLVSLQDRLPSFRVQRQMLRSTEPQRRWWQRGGGYPAGDKPPSMLKPPAPPSGPSGVSASWDGRR